MQTATNGRQKFVKFSTVEILRKIISAYVHTYTNLMSVSSILTGKGKVHPTKRRKGADGEQRYGAAF
jgi:hypothetical protein